MKSSQVRCYVLISGLIALFGGMAILVTSLIYQTTYSGNYTLNLETWDCTSQFEISKDFCQKGNPPFCRANTIGECFETNGTHDYFWLGSADEVSVTIVPKDLNSIFLKVGQISLVSLTWLSYGDQSLQIIVSGDIVVYFDEVNRDVVNNSLVVKSKDLQPNITIVLGPYDFGNPTIIAIKDVTITFVTPTWCWVTVIICSGFSTLSIISDQLKCRCNPVQKYQLMNRDERGKRKILVNP